MVEDRLKPVVGIDMDGTMMNIDDSFWRFLQREFPEKGYTMKDLKSGGPTDPPRDLEFSIIKRDYLGRTEFIPEILSYGGTPEGIPIIGEYTESIHLISLRWDYQKDSILRLFDRDGYSPYFSSFCLREKGEYERSEIKLKHIEAVRATIIIEDEIELALHMIEAGKYVFLPRRSSNIFERHSGNRVVNRPNLMIVRGIWDIAWGLRKYGSFENFLAVHARSLQDPANLYKVFRADVLPASLLL